MTSKRETINKDERIRRLRLGELKRVLLRRYGHELPEDDAGRADLELLLDVMSFARDARRRMPMRLSNKGSCPLLARSRHGPLHRTCPLSGVKQT